VRVLLRGVLSVLGFVVTVVLGLLTLLATGLDFLIRPFDPAGMLSILNR